MLETDPSFRPIRLREGYPPLEDLGLIGDGATVALVGLDGSIYWLCLPRFDSEPVFCGLLDRDRGGHFTIAPDELTEARQRYQPDTGVLITELRSPTGLVRLTDALALRSGADLTDDVPGGRGELVRSAVVLDGSVRLRVDVEPRGGAQTWMAASGLRLNPSRRPDLQLHLRSNRPLSGLHGTYDLKQGDSLNLVLSWGRFLPAPVGGVRNWDYRYTWIRDAAFTVFALRWIGFGTEADAFLGWVLGAFEQSRQPRIMYDLDGSPVPDEWEDPELEGYRRSAPVRWGNGAADQRQHDVYGAAIAERLSAGDGLLYRYLHHDSPDGIAGDEGAFVLCSFWLVDNLAMQGRLDEAGQLYASLCGRASLLGLLSEQIDPSTGEFIGNFPQAFSHIGVIASGVTLARAHAAAGGHAATGSHASTGGASA
jgi:GH15 family glucan-1,4-alpha-glucosidase